MLEEILAKSAHKIMVKKFNSPKVLQPIKKAKYDSNFDSYLLRYGCKICDNSF